MRSIKDIAKWYFSKAALPYWAILLLDCVFVICAGFIAYTLNNSFETSVYQLIPLSCTIGISLACFIVSFRLYHTYDGVIRFSSFTDLMRISLSAITSMALFYVIQLLIPPTHHIAHFSLADILLAGLLTVAMMWMVRVIVKTSYDQYIHGAERPRAFILGVKEGGFALAKNLNSTADSKFKIAGFFTEDADLIRKHLMGAKIYSLDSDIISIMKKEGAQTIIVAPSMMQFLRDNEEFANNLIDKGIKILVYPQVRTWVKTEDFRESDLKPIAVEDLLPRDKIVVDMKAAEDQLRDNVVMITGAAGSIGSEMVRQIAPYKPSKLILIDQAETPMHDVRLMMHNQWADVDAETIVASITDKVLMERIFKKYNPKYVFHAAAYKHVPMMEDNPYESVVNNIFGTKVIADLSVKYNVSKFVMVSTDKAVNPTNVMGCSKRICEIYVQSLDKAIKDGKVSGITQFVTTRFGNVLGSNGSVIPLFEEQIKKGGPITVTHPDIIRYFMLIPEACKLVIEAGTIGKGGEIYVFDMGKPVKIADLAKRMIRLSGAKHIEILYTGLRDGEKLYEEVLNDAEQTLPTFHPKIKIAKVREYQFDEVLAEIDNLILSAQSEDDMDIVGNMKSIVPEFKSQHSVYEVLDEKSGQKKSVPSSTKADVKIEGKQLTEPSPSLN